jgi:enoyl-CoA hydratase
MSFQTLFTKMEDHTLIITINRPDKLNALNQQVMKDLDAVMDRVYKFPEIKSLSNRREGCFRYVVYLQSGEYLYAFSSEYLRESSA